MSAGSVKIVSLMPYYTAASFVFAIFKHLKVAHAIAGRLRFDDLGCIQS